MQQHRRRDASSGFPVFSTDILSLRIPRTVRRVRFISSHFLFWPVSRPSYFHLTRVKTCTAAAPLLHRLQRLRLRTGLYLTLQLLAVSVPPLFILLSAEEQRSPGGDAAESTDLQPLLLPFFSPHTRSLFNHLVIRTCFSSLPQEAKNGYRL